MGFKKIIKLLHNSAIYQLVKIIGNYREEDTTGNNSFIKIDLTSAVMIMHSLGKALYA